MSFKSDVGSKPVLAISFEGVERQAIDLFTALENEISLSGFEVRNKRIHRELSSLRPAMRTEYRRRKSWGNSVGFHCGS